VSLDLAPLEGALRVRLGETDWAACVSAAGLDVAGPLMPAQPASGQPVAADLRRAVALAVSGPTLVQLTTASQDRGLVASLGSDGVTAAGAVRIVVPAGVAGPAPAALPGVEVSAFTPERLVGEVLRLVPPDRPVAAVPEPVQLPHTVALMLNRALTEDDEPLVRELAAASGWTDVPELLRELATQVTATATVVLRSAGAAPRTRRWLQCRLGWVEIAVAGAQVTHRPVQRSDLAATLVEELTIALERTPAVVGR